MNTKPNPLYRSGDRNFQCSYYEQCRKHAFKNQWTFWTCSDCDHRLMGTPVTLVGRKAKSVSLTQQGRFQLVSKKWIGPDSASPGKTNVAMGHKNDRATPTPFRFHYS